MFFFFKQKTAYEMRISDWSSDVCSSDLLGVQERRPESVARSVRGEGLYRARLAQSLWRRGAHPRADQGLQTGNEAHPCALAARQLRYLDARPRAAAIRHRGAESRVSQPDRARRNTPVTGRFGAGLGKRSRVPATLRRGP